MANLQRKFTLTILIGVLLLLTNNAKTIAVQCDTFTSTPTNDHPPTYVKHACSKDVRDNITPSPPHSFDQKARLSSRGSNSLHYSLQPSNYVDRIFRAISEGDLAPRHNRFLLRDSPYRIARLVPQGPNPILNR